MSAITHSLVGYDRRTERVAEEFDVPDPLLASAKELAGVPADDPDAMMCYRLDPSVARDLADILSARINTARHDYFLEGSAAVGSSSAAAPPTVVKYEFADDAQFRPSGLEWSVWIHNAANDHVEIIIKRATLDDYAARHSLGDHRTVINLLNRRINDRVRAVANRAIDGGSGDSKILELHQRDLTEMLADLGG